MANALTYQSEFTGQQMDERFTAVATLTAALEALTGVVAQKYVKPSDGIPSTDMTAAVQASLAKAESAVQSLADYYTKTEVDQLLAAINGMDYVDVSTLPTASASTMGKIYLLGPDSSGYYAYYYTSYDGTSYSWVGPLGTTEISLSNYATKAELNQLDQEIINKFSDEPETITSARWASIYFVISSDVWTAVTGTIGSRYFSIKKGQILTIQANSLRKTQWAFLSSAPTNIQDGDTPAYADAVGLRSIDANNTETAVAPSDCWVYVRYRTATSTNSYFPQSITVLSPWSKIDEWDALEEDVETLEEATESLSTQLSGKAAASDVEQLQKDVYGTETRREKIQYARTDGENWALNPNNYFLYMEDRLGIWLAITPGKSYVIVGDENYNVVCAVLKAKPDTSSQTPQDAVYATGYNDRTIVSADTEYSFVAPADAAWVFLSLSSSNGNLYPELYEVIEGQEGLVEKVGDLEEAIGGISVNAVKYYRLHPVTQLGENQSGTIVGTVYSSEYATVDVEKYRGCDILVHNVHSATGCSQLLDGSGTVLETFDGEDSSVGLVTIPDTAKKFVISNSFVKNPDFYIEAPDNLVRKNGLIFGENFLSDYDEGDFSQFKGTVTAGSGLVLPGTGASNGLIVDRVIALDNWSLVADILTVNNDEVVNLGTKITQQGTSANHSTRVEIDFDNETISIYNNATGNLAVTDSIASIVNGNIYSVKLERIDRLIKASLVNRKTGAVVSVESPDGEEGSGNEGLNSAGKMFDQPVFYVSSGSPYLQNLYATCLRNAKVFIVGDSNTQGAHTTWETSWAPMAAEYFGNSLTGGRGSGHVTCTLNQLRSLLPAVRPKAVIVTVGTNYNGNISSDGYLALFKAIIKVILDYDAIPIINPVTACNSRKSDITVINGIINGLKQIGCRFDLATSLNNDWADGQNTSLYYTDNIHLNTAGNAVIYNVVTTQLGWLKNL